MEKRKTTYRRPQTDAEREKWNAYRREYRREHPEKVRQWRLNAARRLLALSESGQNGRRCDE